MLVDKIYSYSHLGIRKPPLDNDEVLTGTDYRRLEVAATH